MDVSFLAQSAEPVDCGVENASLIGSWACELTDSRTWTGIIEVVVGKPLAVLTILVLAWVVNRVGRRGLRKMIARIQKPTLEESPGAPRSGGKRGLHPRQAQRASAIEAVMRSVLSVAVWGIATVTILAELGISIGPIVASAGVIGIALGFGAQSLVKDWVAGFFMLLEDQYAVGDIIDAGEASGVVEGVTLRATRLRDVQGTLWHIPNGSIARVGNFSQEWARALLDVEVAYNTDLDHARAVIKRVADEVWKDERWATLFLEEPEVWGVETLGESSIAIRLVIKVKPGKQWEITREINARMKARFDEEGIEIPFPQQTMWVRGEQADTEAKVEA